jgi:hypothetical protein
VLLDEAKQSEYIVTSEILGNHTMNGEIPADVTIDIPANSSSATPRSDLNLSNEPTTIDNPIVNNAATIAEDPLTPSLSAAEVAPASAAIDTTTIEKNAEPTDEPVAPALTEAGEIEAERWAEVDDEGNVYLKATSLFPKRVIGKLRGKDQAGTFAHLVSKFRDQEEKINIIETGLTHTEDKRIYTGRVRSMLEFLPTANALGDFDTLVGRLREMEKIIETHVQQERKVHSEAKEALIAKAEGISQSSDWKATADQMKTLFDDWKKVGSAGREEDDVLWGRFNTARDAFFERRRQHYEALDKEREGYRECKEKLCIEAEKLKDSMEWEATGERLKVIQTEWKTIGFAGRVADDALWDRFHSACDQFFNRRIEHYRVRDQQRDEARAQKEQLCERAETLREYSRGSAIDFKAVADAFKDLQADWKKVGSAGRKFDDKLWDRFRAAADDFFDRRGEQISQQRIENRERMRDTFERKQDQLLRLKESLSRDEANISRWRESLATARAEYRAELEAKIADVTARTKEKNQRLQELSGSVEGMQRRIR